MDTQLEKKPPTHQPEEDKELKPYQPPEPIGMIQITESVDEIVAKFKKYEEVKEKILNPDDYYEIKSKNGKPVAKALGKAGLYKLGVAFNLDTVILQEERIMKQDDPQYIAYKTMVQCRAPNGRVAQDVGFCDNTERDRHNEAEHVIRSMATTRAKERAYITMIGAPEKATPSVKDPGPEPTSFCLCEGGPKTKPDGKCNTCGQFSKLWWESQHGKTVS